MKQTRLLILIAGIVTSLGSKAQELSFKRFENNPIITAALLQGTDGDNINGPTLTKVPEWLPNKLGKYYLYFAHHKGKYIRLAYSNNLQGPWTVYMPGTLQLSDCKVCEDGLANTANSIKHVGAESADDEVTHIASPDVLPDNDNKQLVMYFHCPLEKGKYKGQYSFRATSKDGIRFKADTTVLGFSYFRVFKWHDNYYSMSRAGLLAKSKDGIAAFEKGPNPFAALQDSSNYVRHVGIRLAGDTLLVFYSRVGDAPERILLSKIALNDNWNSWFATKPIEVVAPDKDYEGGKLPVSASQAGLYYGEVRQLRDPYVYEENGKLYLLYSVAGEAGIAIGEIKVKG